MKVDSSLQYQYIKIDDYCFCLNQNAAVLAWILFFKRDNLITIFTPWVIINKPCEPRNYFRYWYRLFKSNSKILYKFIQYQLNMRNMDFVVELPFYGHVCMQVHKGYKIFNFRSKVVTKCFDSDVSRSSIESEIDNLKKVVQIDFAPSIRGWNIDARWFEEDYIGCSIDSSQRSLDSDTVLNRFYNDIVPCLNYLTSFKNPSIKYSFDYIDDIIGGIDLSKSSSPKFDEKEVNKISSFVHSIVEQLKIEGNCPVQLVFSHGDFCPANIFKTKNGIRIVDWESAMYRSLLFDFYSYFFYRPVCRELPVHKCALEIKEALPFYLSRLSLKPLNISKDILAIEKVYRKIYYIERIFNLIERNVTDNQLDILDFISRYIDAFIQYEKIVNGVSKMTASEILSKKLVD